MGEDAGRSRDQGITGLAKAAFDFDPESSLNWATEIDNDDMRKVSLEIGIREWRKRDPEAAEQWAELNGMGVDEGKGEAENQ